MNLNDLFTVTTLTAAINKLPLMPTKAGATGVFTEEGVATTSVTIEEVDRRLVLVKDKSRSEDAQPVKSDGRTRRTFRSAHLPLQRAILPEELQNIAAFGQDTAINSQATVINNKLQSMKDSIDATREWYRVGAIGGKILDADGSVIEDLYDAFGVTKKSMNVAFSTATTNVLKSCLDAKRWSEKKLGGVMVTGYKAFCDAEFFDALIGHETVKRAFENYQAAQDRLAGDMRTGFTFGGIEYVEYEVTVSGQKFIPSGTARVFPVGKGVFSMFSAPANYNETVNTLGLPFYAKAKERDFNKGWDIEVQTNPVAICMYPEALVELKAA